MAAGEAYDEDQLLDDFGFFAPLDRQFLEAIVAYGRSHGFAYTFPFWTGQFFAYLTCAPALAAMAPSAVRSQEAAA